MGTIRVLVQTTIPPTTDDWHVGRFSLLTDHLSSTRWPDGTGIDVTARNLERDASGVDRVLASLPGTAFDVLWLLAVDVGGGLVAKECAGVEAFQKRGGGLLAARDHQDLGCSLAALPGVGEAHHFHTLNLDPVASHRCADDRETRTIDWPNYHSGRNGDVQEVHVVALDHPLMQTGAGARVRHFPAHPHEGSVGPAAGGQVIATGRSHATGRDFNLVVARDTTAPEGPHGGRWIAESSFHHFADYNWDPRKGAPSFVSEPVGDAVLANPRLLDDVRTYVTNAVRWLTRR
jgi:hypothetical protein